MARLWKKTDVTRQGKYLVKRRDGTVPKWLWFVLGSRDPAAPVALRAYAQKCDELGKDPAYVRDLYDLADEYDRYREEHGEGDPDAGPHRVDDPATVAEMALGNGS